MRLATVFLTLSIAANLGLGLALFSTPASLPKNVTPAAAVFTKTKPAQTDDLIPRLTELGSIYESLNQADFPSVIHRLRIENYPKELIRLLANAWYNQQITDLRQSYEADGSDINGYAKTREQRRKRAEYFAQIRECEDLLRNEGISDNMWDFIAQRRRKPPLSEEKLAQLDWIEKDRVAMRSRIYTDGAPMLHLDSDQDALRAVDEDYQKSLKELLTPEEYEAWKYTSSDLATALHQKVGFMQPTPDEFKAIYDLTESAHLGDITDWEQQQQAQRNLDSQLAAALGPERYETYQKSQSPDYGLFTRLQYRLKLPKDTADQLYSLINHAKADARLANKDPSLDENAREDAVKAILDQTKEKLSDYLTPQGQKQYLSAQGHWIDMPNNWINE